MLPASLLLLASCHSKVESVLAAPLPPGAVDTISCTQRYSSDLAMAAYFFRIQFPDDATASQWLLDNGFSLQPTSPTPVSGTFAYNPGDEALRETCRWHPPRDATVEGIFRAPSLGETSTLRAIVVSGCVWGRAETTDYW
jgi:hypothetical protein